MLIIKKHEKSAPATFTHVFRGKPITLTVRPLDKDEIRKIQKKHTSYEFAHSPKTGKLERVAIVDEVGLGKDVMDHLLIGFGGFGMSQDKPLEVTRENKLLIVNLEPDDGEPPLHEIIQKKAQELAEIVKAEAEEDAKNSGGAPVTD